MLSFIFTLFFLKMSFVCKGIYSWINICPTLLFSFVTLSKNPLVNKHMDFEILFLFFLFNDNISILIFSFFNKKIYFWLTLSKSFSESFINKILSFIPLVSLAERKKFPSPITFFDLFFWFNSNNIFLKIMFIGYILLLKSFESFSSSWVTLLKKFSKVSEIDFNISL